MINYEYTSINHVVTVQQLRGPSLLSGDDDSIFNDDNDDECMNNFFLLCHGALENGREVTKRKTKWEHDRISWYSHVEKLNHEDAFEKIYRMPLRALYKLVSSLLESAVTRNYSKAVWLS